MQQQIDIDTIQQILNGSVVEIMPILDRGEVNRVYVIKQATRKVIFRLNDAGEIKRFKKESWCIEQASEEGIPTSHIIEIGEKNNLAYMVLNYISGLNGNDVTADKSKIWFELGFLAKKIHAIETVGFGEVMIKPGEFSDRWDRYIDYNITSLDNDDVLLTMGLLSWDNSKKIKKRFTNLHSKQFQFGLIHGDLSLANVIVNNEKVTLIDWGSAESTIVPHFELAGILEDSLSENDPLFNEFLRGYGINQEGFKQIRSDISTIILLRAVDKLRWAIDRNPDKIEQFSKRLSKSMKLYL